MVIQQEIKDFIETHLQFMVSQTKSYVPFIKTAFPIQKNLADSCYSLIAGNALSVFISQYAMRMKYPSEEDLKEFGIIAEKYRTKIEKLF